MVEEPIECISRRDGLMVWRKKYWVIYINQITHCWPSWFDLLTDMDTLFVKFVNIMNDRKQLLDKKWKMCAWRFNHS